MKLRVSQLNKLIFPEIITHIPENEKKIYLTFDDGPTPGITNQVLVFLSKYNAKVTFFCRGDNVSENPELFREITANGHITGNHGYSHLNGWTSGTEKYVSDCKRAAEIIPNRIFRPPYGKITPAQYNQLKKDFTIYLWTALTWDFHLLISPERCLKNALKNLTPGAIIVFHDTHKASDNLLYALPRILETGLSRGYTFVSLPVNKENDRTGNAARESFEPHRT